MSATAPGASYIRLSNASPAAEAFAGPKPHVGMIRTLAVWSCCIAIASVPVFSSQEGLSVIPQVLSFVAVGFVCLSLVQYLPRVHASVLAYAALVSFWAFTLMSNPEVWETYQTLLKVCILAFAAHLALRREQDLLLLFRMYCATGIITVILNWDQLHVLGASLSSARALNERDRFAGTFANANTAGIYGVILMLSALVLLFNGRSVWRWLLVVVGLLAGLGICFFSGSRKAMLGIGFLVIMTPIMSQPSFKTGRRSLIRTLGVLVPMLVLGGVLFSHLPFVDRFLVFFTDGLRADSSSETRWEMLVRVFQLWSTHPIFGCGFDGFSRLSEFGVYSHTTFGEILCNGGLIGLLLFAFFLGWPALQLLILASRSAVDKQRTPSRLPFGLFAFVALFTIFCFFAVLYDSREYIPVCAGIFGVIQEKWQADSKLPAFSFSHSKQTAISST